MNKTCDITNVVLSGNIIDYVHKTKYLGVLLCSDMTTSIDVCRQTSKLDAQANTLFRNFRYCSDDVKCMLFRTFCTNMYCSPLCVCIFFVVIIMVYKGVFNGGFRGFKPAPQFSDFFLKSEGKEVERKRKKM